MQLCTGGLWGEEEKKGWQQMLAQVPILKKKKTKKTERIMMGISKYLKLTTKIIEIKIFRGIYIASNTYNRK